MRGLDRFEADPVSVIRACLLRCSKDRAAPHKKFFSPDCYPRSGDTAKQFVRLRSVYPTDAIHAQLLKSQAILAFSIAQIYAFLGEPDQVPQWLDRAYARRRVFLYHIKGEPHLRISKTTLATRFSCGS